MDELLKPIFKNSITIQKLMENYSKLLESPMRMKSFDVEKLSDNANNYACAKSFINNGTFIKKYKEYDLYRYKHNNIVADAFIIDEFIYAYFVYNIKNNIFIEKLVWQNMIHSGLCRDIIFNYYLKEYKVIISDGLHSPLGESYWKKLLKDSKNKGYKIYVVDLDRNISQELNMNDIDKFYGDNSYNINYKFMILLK